MDESLFTAVKRIRRPGYRETVASGVDRSAYDKPSSLDLQIKPPRIILLLLVTSVFATEVGVMLFLHLWPDMPTLPEALIDATILVLALSPTFYFFHYFPLKQHIRQRNAAIDQLRISEERLQLALQAVNDGLWDWDIKSGNILFSPRCAEMLGFESVETGIDFSRLLGLVHRDDRPHFDGLLNEHLAGRSEVLRIELRLKSLKAPGEWIWVLVRGKVVEMDERRSPLRAVGTNTDITLRKQAEASLHKSREEVRCLSQQLINNSEIEKKRLAQELHDDFGQMITAFSMGVEMIQTLHCEQQPELERHCHRLLEIGKRMQGSLREICDHLRPAILDDLGLVRTLDWMIDRFRDQHRRINIHIRLPEHERRLPPDLELICYRVCQEALHNISKHARSTQVEVVLDIRNESVRLTINDNGCGFNPQHRRSSDHWGIGLLGMHERAAAVGGCVQVESSIGKGTLVALALPCNLQE